MLTTFSASATKFNFQFPKNFWADFFQSIEDKLKLAKNFLPTSKLTLFSLQQRKTYRCTQSGRFWPNFSNTQRNRKFAAFTTFTAAAFEESNAKESIKQEKATISLLPAFGSCITNHHWQKSPKGQRSEKQDFCRVLQYFMLRQFLSQIEFLVESEISQVWSFIFQNLTKSSKQISKFFQFYAQKCINLNFNFHNKAFKKNATK